MCKGRHLEWYEIKIAMLLKGFGFSRRTIAEALGVTESALKQREESCANRVMQNDTRDLEELCTVIQTIIENENSFITKKFKELFKRCLEIEKVKSERIKEMYRRRCQEI